MASNGWEQLVSPYFVPVCAAELGAYFSSLGLRKSAAKTGSVSWTDERHFVEISHLPETSPNIAINVFVGLGDSLFDKRGNYCGVPIWFSRPADEQRNLDDATRFNSEQKLRAVLMDMREAILPAYVEPLLKDDSKLRTAIDQFRNSSRT